MLRVVRSNLLGFLTLFFLYPSPLWSADTEGSADVDAGMGIYREFARLLADDPGAAKSEALKRLQESYPVASPEWLQVLTFLVGEDAASIPSNYSGPDYLKEAALQADKLGLSAIALQLSVKVRADELRQKKAKPEEWDAFHNDVIAQAKAKDLVRIIVHILMNKAYDAYNSGDMKKALEFSKEALSVLDKKLPLDDLQSLDVKNNMAMFLEYSQERDRARAMYEEVIDHYRRMGLRYRTADTSYNYGVLLMNMKNYHEAQKAFQLVADTGRELKSILLQGRAMKGLAFAQSRTGMMRQAIASYTQSIELMKKANEDPVGITDAYKLLADCYNKEKNWEMALKSISIAASDTVAMQDKKWQNQLMQSKVDALVGLGRFEEALKISKYSNELYEQDIKEEKQAEISKLKVAMGLQLEEQKNAALLDQNRTQEEKLRQAEILRRFFYGVLALSFMVILLLIIAWRQAWKVKQSRERVHRILEHIEEGILSIGIGMTVEADLSPYLAKLLGIRENIKSKRDIFQSLLDGADLEIDERVTIRAALGAALGEDALAWELNQGQLPREVSIQGGVKLLNLEWQPIYSQEGRVQSVLVTVRDITAKRTLQNEVAAARAHVSRLEQRLNDILQIDARAAAAFVAEVRAILPSVRPRIETNQDLLPCYRQLHTLKGVARSLGFKEMSSLVHTLEDQFNLERGVLRSHGEALRILGEIEEVVTEYTEIIEKVYFRQSEVAGARAQSLIDLVASSVVPVRSLLERAGLELAQLEVQDHVGTWSREWLDIAQIMLLHGMTNGADHGFILPRRRGVELDKKAAFTIKAWRSADALCMELLDNGAGLDFPRLQQLAEHFKFKPQAHETMADVVFLDGVSTADEVSTSSGRGMGMAALHAKVSAAHGTVNLRANPNGRGSSLLIRMPTQSVIAA